MVDGIPARGSTSVDSRPLVNAFRSGLVTALHIFESSDTPPTWRELNDYALTMQRRRVVLDKDEIWSHETSILEFLVANSSFGVEAIKLITGLEIGEQIVLNLGAYGKTTIERIV